MPSRPSIMQRYGRIDVTEEAVINEFNSIEQIYIRFQGPFGLNKNFTFRANCLSFGHIVISRTKFFRPPNKMFSRTPMALALEETFAQSAFEVVSRAYPGMSEFSSPVASI